MKRITFLQSLLVAAGLCVGANAWAVDVTTNIDFNAFVESSIPDITLGSDAISQNGTNALTVYQLTNNGTNFDRIALSHTNKSDVQQRWMFRNESTFKKGLCGNWNSKGTANDSYNLSVLNLKEGDRITITWDEQSGKGAGPKFCSAGVVTSGTPATDNEAESTMASGTEYTMKADGNLDLYSTNNNLGIHTIVIKSTGTESIDAMPNIKVTGANNGDRTITIAGSQTNAGNETITYYTKDGTEPTSSSTQYTEPFTITSSDADGDGNVTIKAITYKDGDVSIASDVATNVIAVGATLSLAAITSTLTNMATYSGISYPVYTFANNNSSVIGTPASTLSAIFTPEGGSAAAATLTDNAYTFNQKGTLTVTAHADGYTDVNTSITVSDSYEVNRTLNLANCADINAVTALVTLVNQDYWQIRENQGVYNNNSGNRAVTLVSANEGEVALFYYYNNSTPQQAVKYNNGISWSMPRYNTLEKIVVYSLKDEDVIGAPDCTSTYRSAFGEDIVVANGSAKKVTFKNHGSGTGNEYYKNWVLDINYGGELVTTVRSDWYAFGVGAFTYGYTYSSDGGTTADNTNVWGSWYDDNAESHVELTLSHVDGKLYVVGTMTKDSKVYYVNYTYGDGTQTDDFTMNLSIDHSWIEMESVEDADAETTPLHPSTITTTVGEKGYSTYSSIYPLDLSSISGAKSYYAKTVDTENSKVVFESATGTVPASEGLLLKGEANASVSFTIADAGSTISGNKLVGCTEPTTLVSSANYYVLVNNGDTPEFQCLNEQGATIPAGKAYLDATEAGGDAKLRIVFEGEATGIEAIETSEAVQNGEVYNLAGQRVAAPVKGLYIVNGKKVLVK